MRPLRHNNNSITSNNNINNKTARHNHHKLPHPSTSQSQSLVIRRPDLHIFLLPTALQGHRLVPTFHHILTSAALTRKPSMECPILTIYIPVSSTLQPEVTPTSGWSISGLDSCFGCLELFQIRKKNLKVMIS